MKKSSSKQVAVYVALFGVLALVAVYFLVYKAYMDKAEQITASNATLSARVNELKEYYEDIDFYNGEIEMMQNQIYTWFDEFPADVLEEDILVLALDTEEVAWINYSKFSVRYHNTRKCKKGNRGIKGNSSGNGSCSGY